MSATYTYDALGRRLAKEVDGVRTQMDWTGYAPAGTYDDGGTPTARWHRCPVTGEVIGLEQGAYRGLVFSDHLGSPRAVAGYASGGVDWQAEYPAYGDAAVDPAATVELPVRFPGQVLDEETGLHYNVFRYYDPASGRYLSPDPVWSASESRYAYVGGTPQMLTDPVGLQPKQEWVKEKSYYVDSDGYVHVLQQYRPLLPLTFDYENLWLSRLTSQRTPPEPQSISRWNGMRGPNVFEMRSCYKTKEERCRLCNSGADIIGWVSLTAMAGTHLLGIVVNPMIGIPLEIASGLNFLTCKLFCN
jgi:RHS repeat-associated protein